MDWRDDGKFVGIVMEDGEDFVENILKLVEVFKDEKILAVISALGMLSDIEVGYWTGSEYEIHEVKEPAELLGVSGIITPETDPPYHFHILVGTKEGEVKGGHLLKAKVKNTVEMFLIKGNIQVTRREEGGLKKLKFV